MMRIRKFTAGLSRVWTVLLIGFLSISLAQAQSFQWGKPPLTSVPSARCCAALAYDAVTKLTILFGGGNGGISPRVRYNDTWVLSPQTKGWSQLSPATSPSPRQGAAIAYDPTTQSVVLFGGNAETGLNLNDTWTWNGVTWTQQFPPVSPPASEFDSQEMAYDAATKTVVLFDQGSSGLGDTWEWNGPQKTWTQKFPATSPPQSNATLAYDAAHHNIVLFGGCCTSQGPLNQTWIWDGVNWTQLSPSASPSARSLNSLAFDPVLGKVVLFGGSAGPPQAYNDTWTWDGTTWSQVQTTYTPTGRWAAGMAFEPNLKGLVMFGGELVGDPFANDTWFFIPVR